MLNPSQEVASVARFCIAGRLLLSRMAAPSGRGSGDEGSMLQFLLQGNFLFPYLQNLAASGACNL